VCTIKDFGGLAGLRGLNLALLGKWCWRFYVEGHIRRCGGKVSVWWKDLCVVGEGVQRDNER